MTKGSLFREPLFVSSEAGLVTVPPRFHATQQVSNHEYPRQWHTHPQGKQPYDYQCPLYPIHGPPPIERSQREIYQRSPR